uniref:Uncharacterized protein n=1 Tax=Panstrongylus lignarius TaxID=156445 RepID=A0A224Y0G4_9HEMI
MRLPAYHVLSACYIIVCLIRKVTLYNIHVSVVLSMIPVHGGGLVLPYSHLLFPVSGAIHRSALAIGVVFPVACVVVSILLPHKHFRRYKGLLFSRGLRENMTLSCNVLISIYPPIHQT